MFVYKIIFLIYLKNIELYIKATARLEFGFNKHFFDVQISNPLA